MGLLKRSKKKGRFTGIPKLVHDSEEWAQLPPTAKALLVDIVSQYNGHNNGDLNATRTFLSSKGWKNQGTISKNLKILIEANFLKQTRRPLQRRCALYAVTWERINDCKGKHLLGDTLEFLNIWKRFSGVKSHQSKAS